MPVTRIGTASKHDRPDLVGLIASELSTTPPPPNQDSPDIREEEIRHSPRMIVTVVWNKWRGVDETFRAPIILDAYERARGVDEAMRIAAALGVTPEEAKSLGIA